jgi:hypothetical protein
MKKLILSILFIVSFIAARATHIVGGQITYEKLPNNSYAVTLAVYRDCFNGVPPFDDPAAVGIFDSNNNLVQSLAVNVDPDSVYLSNFGCTTANFCIVIATYHFTVNLPSTTSYKIVYQRCCRSSIISNLSNPTSYGFSIWAEINPNPLTPNSSAIFNREFPGVAFVNDTLIYDGSASDPDGDSLVYSMDYSYAGADTINPAPNPPFAPPYNSMVYQSPFSFTNLLGGPVPLSVNSNTGMMTAFPNTIGIFQVGQKVEEYRNGILINTQRREFPMFISAGNYFDIGGSVTADTSTQSLDAGQAWLIRKNLYDGTLTAIDTNVINNTYLFPSAINGTYLLKASPDSNSVYYSNNLPTYYGDVLFWQQATEVDACSVDQLNIDINLLPGKNPGGPGFVGGLISLGANRMSSTSTFTLNGCTVFLYNTSNEPVAAAFTDAAGYFSFSNIPTGNYKVYIDRLNWNVDNSLAPTISVGTSLVHYSFLLHPTWLELLGTVGLNDKNNYSTSIITFPNPAKDYIRFSIPLTKESDVLITLKDLTGRLLKQVTYKNVLPESSIVEITGLTALTKSNIILAEITTSDFTKTVKVSLVR